MLRLRTFIAVDVDKAIRDRLVALQDKLAQSGNEVKWVERNNLHVTLLFLGEVDSREVPKVCRVVAEGCAELNKFAMHVETVGCFGNPRRPRTIWAGVGQGKQELCTLHDTLEGPLLDLGCYRREDRVYTPHITLGRVRSDLANDRLPAALAKAAGWQGGEMIVREVHVMSSELTSQGPIYTLLSNVKLA